VVARLLDLGLDANLLSSCLVGTMAQRLVRRMCPHCRRPSAAGAEVQEGTVALSWEARGCDACDHTGIAGRVAVHEIMPVTREIAGLIAQRASVDRLSEAAIRAGMATIVEDGLAKVRAGLVTLADLRRGVWIDGDDSREAGKSDRIAAA
jgi:type II secretory ATPase GspE/PulE/Tfp pilus assembly ATPase PilB-like protein